MQAMFFFFTYSWLQIQTHLWCLVFPLSFVFSATCTQRFWSRRSHATVLYPGTQSCPTPCSTPRPRSPENCWISRKRVNAWPASSERCVCICVYVQSTWSQVVRWKARFTSYTWSFYIVSGFQKQRQHPSSDDSAVSVPRSVNSDALPHVLSGPGYIPHRVMHLKGFCYRKRFMCLYLHSNDKRVQMIAFRYWTNAKYWPSKSGINDNARKRTGCLKRFLTFKCLNGRNYIALSKSCP